MSTSVSRVNYIRHNYSLTQDGGEWVARGGDGIEFRGFRSEVIRLARCNWGHFNFQDEADTFNEIFR